MEEQPAAKAKSMQQPGAWYLLTLKLKEFTYTYKRSSDKFKDKTLQNNA